MLKQSPLISIIVTAYNVEDYIAQCIKSLIKQTYKNLEIILVNDGSPDNSLKICEMYALKDKRIKIVNLLVNQGLNKARFQGLNKSTGQFVIFVDSDDYISSDAVQVLFNEAYSTGADIVEGNMYRVLDGWGLIKKKVNKKRLEISQPMLFDDYYISFFGVNKLGVNLCGKIYKRSLFDIANLHPNGFKMGEDLITNMQIFPYVQKYVVLDKCVYYYRYGGMTSKFNPTLYDDLKMQYKLKIEAIRKYDYNKALNSSKIEMCNILCSHLIQMFKYKIEEKNVKYFVLRELESGFIDEITNGVEYSKQSFSYLKNKDIEQLLLCCKRMANEKKVQKYIFNKIFPLLRYI